MSENSWTIEVDQRRLQIDVTDVGDGLFRATSPGTGLFIHGETIEELREVVPDVLRSMLLAGPLSPTPPEA